MPFSPLLFGDDNGATVRLLKVLFNSTASPFLTYLSIYNPKLVLVDLIFVHAWRMPNDDDFKSAPYFFWTIFNKLAQSRILRHLYYVSSRTRS